MSMKSVDGGDMPFTMGQVHELAMSAQRDLPNPKQERFELPAATVRAKLASLGHPKAKIDRFLELTQRPDGKVALAVSAPKVKGRQ